MYYGHPNLYTRGRSDIIGDSSFFHISKIGDNTFADNGVYTESRGNLQWNAPINTEKILIQSDGKILYGSSQPTYAARRLLANGTPDMTFNDVPFPFESFADGSDFKDFTVAFNDEIYVALSGGIAPFGTVAHYDKDGNELRYIWLPNSTMSISTVQRMVWNKAWKIG